LQAAAAAPVIKCPMVGLIVGLSIKSLPWGWTKFYEAPYSSATVTANIRPRAGDCLLWGASKENPPVTLAIAAFGNRKKVENDVPLWDNEVYWYTEYGSSAGFSATGDVVTEPGDTGLYDCRGRLSWLLNGQGGYRAGCTDELDNSNQWRKLVFYGPAGVFCSRSVCFANQILNTEGQINYCRGSVCTPDECCQPARQCTVEVCALGFLLKQKPPPYCATAFCQEVECCEKAPKCTAPVCGIGYFLKPEDEYPPRGQPHDGCKKHVCERDECCNESPFCPAEVCTGNFTLETLAPPPLCSSYTCTEADCCTLAGVCAPSDCSLGFTLKGKLLPQRCRRPVCTEFECCDYLPPKVKVSGLWFQDVDLNNRTIGGELTWVVPPPSIPNVTSLDVYIGSSPTYKFALGRLTSSATSLSIDRNTKWDKYFFVYTANVGGVMPTPAVFEVSDSALLPLKISFVDEDLDEGQIGGAVTWPRIFDDDNSTSGAVCRTASQLRVVGGFGNRSHGVAPSFYLDGEMIANFTIPYGSIAAVELTKSMKQVESKAFFLTGEDAGEAARFEMYLAENVSSDRVLLLATWGNTYRYLNTMRVGLFLEATEFPRLRLDDSYAFIGIKRPNFTLRERWTPSTHEAPSIVELACPLAAYNVKLTSGDTSRILGVVPSGESSVVVPGETKLEKDTRIEVVVDSLYPQAWKFTLPVLMLLLQDGSVSFTNVRFVEDEPTNKRVVGGVVTWEIKGNAASEVTFVRVYLSGDEAGTFRVQVGEDVPVARGELVIPRGTLRYNATYILIYAVSGLAEESQPTAAKLSDLQSETQTSVVIAIIGSVAVLQFAKIMEALERSARKMDNKDIADVPMRGKFLDDEGNHVKIIGGGPLGVVPWRGPVSQLCGPCGVSYHDKCVKMTFKTAQERKRLPCLQKAKLITKARMIFKCENAWDNDDLVLKKISNKQIAVFRKTGEAAIFTRVSPLYWKIIETSRICSRKAIKMYAPMVALLGIAFLVAYSGQILMAVMLLVLAASGALIIVLASRMACTPDLLRLVKELPPPSIRKKFWNIIEVMVGCLPCAPAFLAGTGVGYCAGILGLVGSYLRAKKALGLATLLEGFGGLAITAYVMFFRKPEDTAEAAKTAATLMAGLMIAMKAVDTKIENLERLHSVAKLKVDDVIKAAEETSAASSIGMWNAVVLEAFSRSECPERMQSRLAGAIKVAANGVALQALTAVEEYLKELHHGNDTKWPKSPDKLAYVVGRAIDAASQNLHLQELQHVKANNKRQEIRKKIERGLGKLEDSLRNLLNGQLSSKRVTMFKATVKELTTSLSELSSDLGRVRAQLGGPFGVSDDTGRHACAQVALLYTRLVFTTAQYVQDQVENGKLSAVDLRLLFVKLEQMRSHGERAQRVLEGMHSDTGEEAHLVGDVLQAVRQGTDVLSKVDHAPLKSDVESRLLDAIVLMQKRAHSLEEVLEEIEASSAAAYGDIDPQILHDATFDIECRTQGKNSEAFLIETAKALGNARMAVGLVACVNDEIQAALDRAESVVTAMAEARRQGYRVLHSVSQAKEVLSGMSAIAIRKLQLEVIEYTLGAPVAALVALQEVSNESVRDTHEALLSNLQRMSEQLGTRTDVIMAGPQMSTPKRASWCDRLRNKKRVHPEPDEDDDADGIDLHPLPEQPKAEDWELPEMPETPKTAKPERSREIRIDPDMET